MCSNSILNFVVVGIVLFVSSASISLAKETSISPFSLNTTDEAVQSRNLRAGRKVKQPGPPRCESNQNAGQKTGSLTSQPRLPTKGLDCEVSELENLRARGDRSYLHNCLVDFSDSSAIDFLPDDARYTFTSAPFWYQNCHTGIWAHMRAAEYNHYHLSYENQTAADCVHSAFSDDGCDIIDPVQESRTLNTHTGQERIRIMVLDDESKQMPFDMKTIHVTTRPVRFCYKKVQEIKGPWLTNSVDDETSPGIWQCWDRLGVGYWDISDWVWSVVEVKITGSDKLSFGLDDIELAVSSEKLTQRDWNVLDGPVPSGAQTALGDGSDERVILQNVIDLAAPGDVIYFPAPPVAYGVAGNLRIDKPLTLLGDGWLSASAKTDGIFGGAELRQLHDGPTILLEIASSDILIDGLRLIGFEYGDGAGAHMLAIAGSGLSPEERYANITVRDCWIQRFRTRGIRIDLAEDVVVANNRVEDVTVSGIFFLSVDRGQIHGNVVEDIADPEIGSAYHPDPDEDYALAYPTVAASLGTEEYPHNTDILIQDNIVRDNPVWTGIMNHGGHNVGIFDNEVYDCDFAYAVTWTDVNGEEDPPALASTRTWFINNYAENSPRNAQWFVGPREEGGSINHAAIGNVYAGTTGPMMVWTQDDLVFSYNSFSGSFDAANRAITWGTEGHYIGAGPITNVSRAGNDLGGGIETFEFDPTYCGESAPEDCILAPPASVPSAPTNFKAVQTGQGILVTWTNTTESGHDSFYIERSADGVTDWTRVAFRPPDDGHWDFGSTNPHWQTFDPLRYLHRGATNGFYRIRAQNGEQTSPWSEIVAVTP